MARRRLIAFLGLWLWPAAALANGRFPAADQILINPDDPAQLALRATFGLLQSRDGGQSWTWVCENAVGYMGDPALALLRGGNLLAGFFGSVSVSAEQGCSWRNQNLDTRYLYPIDVTLDPADPARAWVLTVTVDGSRQVSLLSMNDAGTILDTRAVDTGLVPSTVEVAPSDPQRMYVSAVLENSPSFVLRSSDGGQNWQRFAVPATGGLPLFISAVDPINPDVVYARVDGLTDTALPVGMRPPSDHLLVSRDGGENWDTVFSVDGDLYGFALSPDGSRVAVGGPDLGVFLASARDLDFQPAATKVSGLRCLRWTADGLLACGTEGVDGWTVGRSRDQGQSFEALWHVKDLSPLSCAPASSAGAACPQVWPDVAPAIGASFVAPMGGAGSGGSAGNGSSGGGAASAPPAATADGGCALTAPRAPAAGAPRCSVVLRCGWLLWLGALGWLRRRQGTSM